MRALTPSCLLLGALPALALAACTQNAPPGVAPAVYDAPIGRTVPWRSAVASMAEDYGRPHAGPYVGTGASAWVPPAPPPAYVDTSPPPPRAAEAPPPAAVRNRQPGASAAVAASADDNPRPEAAAPTPAQAAATAPNRRAGAAPAAAGPAAAGPARVASAADIAAGRKMFSDMGCGGCHTLADAGSGGGVGPGFDNNPRLSVDYVFETVHDGRGAMPSFAGQLSDAQIRTLARYLVQVAKK